jgi:hypothetical protein
MRQSREHKTKPAGSDKQTYGYVFLKYILVLPSCNCGANAGWFEAFGVRLLLVRSGDPDGREWPGAGASQASYMELTSEAAMTIKRAAAVFALINLLLPVHLLSNVRAEPAPIRDQGVPHEELYLAVPLPAKDRLTLMDFIPITVSGELLGGLAAYDDSATSRPGDYLELYNSTGDLLAVSWFDAFGIERLAVDRALVEDGGHLQGVFVLLVTGHSV